MKFLILSAIFFVVSHCDSVVRTITLTGNEDLSKVLEETMPKKCTKNGKEYSEGESFEQGHLRYKCQKYGVYTIEGCKSDKGAVMGIGEKLVEGNIASQCFKKGNSVSFRETMCGTLGMPDCDKINQDTPLMGGTGEMESHSMTRTITTNGKGTKEVTGSQIEGLPPGWRIVDSKGVNVPLDNVRVISRTMMFQQP